MSTGHLDQLLLADAQFREPRRRRHLRSDDLQGALGIPGKVRPVDHAEASASAGQDRLAAEIDVLRNGAARH